LALEEVAQINKTSAWPADQAMMALKWMKSSWANLTYRKFNFAHFFPLTEFSPVEHSASEKTAAYRMKLP
jgi:hypothetical protein